MSKSRRALVKLFLVAAVASAVALGLTSGADGHGTKTWKPGDVIAALRKNFPSSHWLESAGALEIDVKQRAGKPVSPDTENTDELKLLALNGLAQSDPERAFRFYQDERQPRTSRVQTLARTWGDYWHLHPGPQKASRDAMLRAQIAHAGLVALRVRLRVRTPSA